MRKLVTHIGCGHVTDDDAKCAGLDQAASLSLSLSLSLAYAIALYGSTHQVDSIIPGERVEFSVESL
jgi:hypothetical protein